MKFFEQGLIKNFQAESAEKILIKVCPEKIEQGLHENPEWFPSMMHNAGFPFIQICLTFFKQGLLENAGTAMQFQQVGMRIPTFFNQDPIDPDHKFNHDHDRV